MAVEGLREAQAKVSAMAAFIQKEADEKASDIKVKGMEEFEIDKFKIVNYEKDKIRKEFDRRAKEVATSSAIQRSMAVNKSRLDKIKARQAVLGRIAEDGRKEVVKVLQDKNVLKRFTTDLIVQGLVMLLEDKVSVRCRQCDKDLVNGCLGDAEKEYSKMILKETTARKACKLTIDEKSFLPVAPVDGADGPSCLGGVILSCQNGTISIDNTIDLRMRLVLEQDKPAIRQLLFPAKAV